jgi:hypothetical protein
VAGQRIGYVVVSTLDQYERRQLEGQVLDCVFTDKASGRDTTRPELTELLRFARDGDAVGMHSMDRLARNLDDLRAFVQGLTLKGVRVEFIKESLVFTGEDSPMANLMLSAVGRLPNSSVPSAGNARRKGSPWPSSAAPRRGEKGPCPRSGRPSWSSGPAATFQKSSLLATTGSAGRRSTRICFKPGCRAPSPAESNLLPQIPNVRYLYLSGTSRSSCETARLGTRAGHGGAYETRDRRHIRCLPKILLAALLASVLRSSLALTIVELPVTMQLTGPPDTEVGWPEKLEKS